jgi:N-acyl-D-amino-acid deacylase
MFDIIIQGAQVIDGSGADGFQADVGVQGERISAIGDLSGAEAPVIVDGAGKVLSPGFIDMHSHSDWTLPVGPRAESKIRQGVTTEVVGMCGSSPAPLTEAQRDEIKAQAAGYRKEMSLSWLSFGEYLDFLSHAGLGVNVVPLAGHGTIRVAAMGHADAQPTPEQLERMKEILAQAMDEGAWGFSTGLIYAPGFFSETPELVELARVASARDGYYYSHIRGEGETLLDAVAEAIAIGEQADIPVQTAHFKASGRSNWGLSQRAIEVLVDARARGVDITSDMYPYVASSTGLSSLVPDWAHDGGRPALLARLANAEQRAAVRQGVVEGSYGKEGPEQWAGILISSCPSCVEREGKTVAELADEMGIEPVDAILAMLEDADGNVGMVAFRMSEENVHTQLREPTMMIGSDGYALATEGPLSEGKPHPRSYGTFPRVLSRYVRERGVLTLPDAVHRMTGLTATKLGLDRRGLVKEGYYADLALFDPATIRDAATFSDPHQYAEGVEMVIVNGVIAIAGGAHGGASAGRVPERSRR